MILIKHGPEPEELKRAKREYKRVYHEVPHYDALPGDVSEGHPGPKRAALESLLDEQGHICAYCMRRIGSYGDANPGHIEHWAPRSKGTAEESVDYRNMLAVCDGGEKGARANEQTCDRRRGSKELVIDPRSDLHMRTLSYDKSGRLCSSDVRLQGDIDDVLNLNSQQLVRSRKEVMREVEKRIGRCYGGCGENSEKGRRRARILLKQIDTETARREPFVGVILWRLRKHLGLL